MGPALYHPVPDKVNHSLRITLNSMTCAGMLLYFAVPTNAQNTQSDQATTKVIVEEISTGTPSNTENAEDLWGQTKKKTQEAAGSAAEYSKVQGTRALEATKDGVAKGADLVEKGADAVAAGSKKAWDATVDTSEKAWDATVDTTKKAVDYTQDKASKVGASVADAFTSNPSNPVIVEKGTEAVSGDSAD